MQRDRGHSRSRSRSPRSNRSDCGHHQHRQHQERWQFSPDRRVRDRSGSSHSSYSDHQLQEQQIAITVENEGAAPSNIPLKVYQDLNRVQQAINGNQIDQEFLRRVQNSNQRLVLTPVGSSLVGGVSVVQQFPTGMVLSAGGVSAMQQYSAVGPSSLPVVQQYPAVGTASVPVVQQYPAVGSARVPAVQQYPAVRPTSMPAVQQRPAVVRAREGSGIQDTGDTKIVNN